MQRDLPASLFLRLCRTELIRESGALTLAALSLIQLSMDVMRRKGDGSEKINRVFFCLQRKKYSSERYRHTLSGVGTATLRRRVSHTRGSWQETWDTNKEGAMGDCMACPPARQPSLRGSPMAVLRVSNLLLNASGTIGRVLFIALLGSLSASPILCRFAPKDTSDERNIILTLQVTLWQTGLDPNSSMQCPNPHCAGAQKYSCTKEHHQSCKIKYSKIR